MINLLIKILENIEYDYEQWKWSRECRENKNDDIDWNFVLGLFFGIGYFIFA